MSLPISDYGMLGDCSSAALVSRDGSVDWLCLPRFDSPSVFGRLLDDDAGHWSVRPVDDYRVTRRYLPETLVLETTFTTATGVVRLTDALLFADGAREHDIGKAAPHVLVRRIEVVEGTAAVAVELAPRPEYGLVRPRLEVVDGGVTATGGACSLMVSGPAPDTIEAGVARWHLDLAAGDAVGFALASGTRGAPRGEPWPAERTRLALADTIEGWRSWSVLHDRYDGHARDLVHLSGRVLYALTYKPTGAIVAAPTTSLPERVGGTRNWDYRYAWVRDTSFTLDALWVAACPDEADDLVDFFVHTAGAAQAHEQGMQIMYGVGGEHDLSERTLDHLAGWSDSRPVRVGNGAWDQSQIDVFGELLDAVHRLRDQFTPSEHTQDFLVGVADAAAAVWDRPDSGIWEARDEPRHYLYSKLMCWVALDRAAALAGWMGAPEREAGWREGAEEIRAAILDRGWNEGLGSFTQSFGSDQLDASTLMMVITGFLDADDPRMVSTIERISQDLTAPGGLVYRYLGDDGIDDADDADDADGDEGGEGVFLLCSYWLVQGLVAIGQADRAHALFATATAAANDLGLLSEEVDPRSGALLGNFPQALSHVGLVNAAHALPPRPENA